MKKSNTPFPWEEHHVTAGMIVCRAHRGKHRWEPEGWTAKWTHKIGYVPGDGAAFGYVPGDGAASSACYCQIAMTDGLVYHCGLTKAQMAERLKEEDMVPMPRVWIFRMMRWMHKHTPVKPTP